MNIKNTISKASIGFVAVALVVPLVLNLVPGMVASATQQTQLLSPPEFPSCENPGGGDWVSSEDGFHHIPGQEETIEGSDDVYYLDGNFLQCLCSVDGENDVATHWWNIGSLDLSPAQLASFISDGWQYLNGQDWNLLDDPYLAKNNEISCQNGRGGSDPTPTPTPTPEPSPTPTPEIVGEAPVCDWLSASPENGTATLSVKFNASAFDPDGTIEEYRFDFDDSSDGQSQIVHQSGSEVTHRYHNSGEYSANVQARDDDGNWTGKCNAVINVSSEPQVLGSSTIESLPKTGFSSLLVSVILLPMSVLAIKTYRRFRLV